MDICEFLPKHKMKKTKKAEYCDGWIICNMKLMNGLLNMVFQGKKIITKDCWVDIETLELFESITDCARTLGVTVGGVYNNILISCKTKGRRLDFFEDWQYLTPKQKEKHTRKNNIFFL